MPDPSNVKRSRRRCHDWLSVHSQGKATAASKVELAPMTDLAVLGVPANVGNQETRGRRVASRADLSKQELRGNERRRNR